MVSISNVSPAASSQGSDMRPSSRFEAGTSRLAGTDAPGKAHPHTVPTKLKTPRHPYNTRASVAAMLSAPLV
jgi:hypothetical protein